jgi:hypothetical protein
VQIKLLVIPKPADGTASIIQGEQTFPPRPLVKGEGEGRGDVDLLCGKCGFAIVQHVESRNTVSELLGLQRDTSGRGIELARA